MYNNNDTQGTAGDIHTTKAYLPAPRTWPRPEAAKPIAHTRAVANVSEYARFAFLPKSGQKWAKAGKDACRTGLRFATATPALAALRLAHEHTRAEHARHARCTRARLASDARALTLQHALARQKQGWHARVTGHWQRVGRRAACTSGSHTRCKCARHLRCSCGACVAHTLYMPCTTTVVTCAER